MTLRRSTADVGASCCTGQLAVAFSVAGNPARTTRLEELVHLGHVNIPFRYVTKANDWHRAFQVLAVISEATAKKIRWQLKEFP
jgi:hypothetical protein